MNITNLNAAENMTAVNRPGIPGICSPSMIKKVMIYKIDYLINVYNTNGVYMMYMYNYVIL